MAPRKKIVLKKKVSAKKPGLTEKRVHQKPAKTISTKGQGTGIPKYYVYQLCCPDTKAPFYVGKGCGERVHSHVVAATNGRIDNELKYAKIASIIMAGKEVAEEIVSRHALESDAFAAEKALISQIGIDNLTNASHGTAGELSRITSYLELHQYPGRTVGQLVSLWKAFWKRSTGDEATELDEKAMTVYFGGCRKLLARIRNGDCDEFCGET